MDLEESGELAMPDWLPSAAEVAQVFKDYKQMLQASRFQTPLQRANELHSMKSSIALSQKIQCEAEHVFNLLPPGHQTCLKVDFFRILLNFEQNIYLRIPVTLLSDGDKVTLLKNSAAGQIVFKTFPSAKSAFPLFESEVARSGIPKPYFPRYIHKVTGIVSTLHSSLDVALRVWQDAGSTPQRLQQFVQPLTKSVSLVRAHWKEAQKLPTFYFISHGPTQAKSRPSLIAQVPTLGRSYSEASIQSVNACINRSSSNLVIHRSKSIPDLDKSLQECVRLLNATLKPPQRVSELVCDFLSDSSHQWVFLACKGFSFQTRAKIRTQTVEMQQKIDIKFLMFPLVARKSMMKRKLERTVKFGAIGGRRRMAILSFNAKPGNDSLMDSSPVLSYEQDLKCFPNVSKPPRPESVIMEREVHRYEKLVKGSRMYKEIKKGTVDIVERYGGLSYWKPALQKTYISFHNSPEIVSLYFEENIGVEEHSQVVNSLLRILKGDYNFYYKETLRKLHQRLCVSKHHYNLFLHELTSIVEGAQMTPADYSITLTRFQQLEEYICSEGDSKQSSEARCRGESR